MRTRYAMRTQLGTLHYLSLRAGPRQWLQWRHRLMSPALDLGDLNDLNDNVVVEVDVKEALKSSIFYRTEGWRTKICRRISPGFH